MGFDVGDYWGHSGGPQKANIHLTGQTGKGTAYSPETWEVLAAAPSPQWRWGKHTGRAAGRPRLVLPLPEPQEAGAAMHGTHRPPADSPLGNTGTDSAS